MNVVIDRICIVKLQVEENGGRGRLRRGAVFDYKFRYLYVFIVATELSRDALFVSPAARIIKKSSVARIA
jgi:hypothetical protein